MIDITPADGVVVLVPEENFTTGTIIAVTENERQKPKLGKIIALGRPSHFDNGVRRELPVEMKVGDVVAYREFGESRFLLGADQYIFVDMRDILSVVKPK